MNINQTIYQTIENLVYDKYSFSANDIQDFMLKEMGFPQRQKSSIDIISDIIINHGKKKLLHYIVELARVEHGISELEPWVRDHVVHALLSFILGIYINEKFLLKKSKIHVPEFEWKIAGLFHDVSYPAQIANDLLKEYSKKLNKISLDLGAKVEDVGFTTVPKNFEKLTNNINGFDLIQARLNEWNLSIDVKTEFNTNINSGKICHGMLSSISILRVIDLMYQTYNPQRKNKDVYVDNSQSNVNWNQEIFENHVVSACSAIFVHNLPAKCFELKKIDRNKAPVAFLLKLSDSLQDWDRPSKEKPKGFPSKHYDIKISDKKLILQTMSSDNRKEKITKEIQDTLLADDIIIM